MIKKIVIFLFLILLLACSKESVDTVEGNTNEVQPEAVADFNYQDIKGDFQGNYNGKKIKVKLDKDGGFQIDLNSKKYKGQFYHIGNDGKIELDSKNGTLPFTMIKIEDQDFLVIINEDSDNENFLERSAQ